MHMANWRIPVAPAGHSGFALAGQNHAPAGQIVWHQVPVGQGRILAFRLVLIVVAARIAPEVLLPAVVRALQARTGWGMLVAPWV